MCHFGLLWTLNQARYRFAKGHPENREKKGMVHQIEHLLSFKNKVWNSTGLIKFFIWFQPLYNLHSYKSTWDILVFHEKLSNREGNMGFYQYILTWLPINDPKIICVDNTFCYNRSHSQPIHKQLVYPSFVSFTSSFANSFGITTICTMWIPVCVHHNWNTISSCQGDKFSERPPSMDCQNFFAGFLCPGLTDNRSI